MPHLSHVNARCSLPDCLILLDDMHSSIRADYVSGALAFLDMDRDLRRRFDATEARIDELAKVPGGPTEYDFRRALAEHAAVWQELIARHTARQEGSHGRWAQLQSNATDLYAEDVTELARWRVRR